MEREEDWRNGGAGAGVRFVIERFVTLSVVSDRGQLFWELGISSAD